MEISILVRKREELNMEKASMNSKTVAIMMGNGKITKYVAQESYISQIIN